jgi:hypothetical protein
MSSDLNFVEVCELKAGLPLRDANEFIPVGLLSLSTQHCAGGKIEKNEVGGACGTHGGGERCAQGSSGETRGK